jgi:hypothetical protein
MTNSRFHEQTLNGLRSIAWVSVSMSPCPCLHVHVSMSMAPCPCLHIHVSMSMSPCLRVHVYGDALISLCFRVSCLCLHVSMSPSLCLHVHVGKRETELMENGNFRFCMLQTENGNANFRLFSLNGNGKRKVFFLVGKR